ncbi:PTS glucose transporter subunit IIA [Spiroplasma endosymbiont of Cantharis lateralis]|uniref:PTS sugar transporter subunit IIA n=1 Tax=Spiroplasma endosymbiont of Cantharis lateralis TaxID=3066277 RepID=UPI00313B92C2
MEINLYSPVDGEIKELKECSDEMFAKKMLGDGFIIIPAADNFSGFSDKATVTMVFKAYHAYGFDIEDLDFLVNVGMDTIALKGIAFSTKLKIGDIVDKNDSLFKVDLNYLEKNNLSKETAIVFDINDLSDYKINNLKIGNVKQGDLVCTITYNFFPRNQKKIWNPQ